MPAFADACAAIARALDGSVRGDIVAALSDGADYHTALLRMRDQMRAHVWHAGPLTISLAAMVAAYDEQTRREGFHVLHDWDGKADAVNRETIAVDVLQYVTALRGAGPLDQGALAILLDYYFLHLLALLSLRVWDDGDPDANLDRVTALLHTLQGPHGSGQRFADDAETLLLIATSHFEVVEVGYDALLARVRTLNRAHQASIALTHAASMGSHLRFGFEATYGRDTIVMRDDNVADYPWLCFALEISIREFVRLTETGAPADARRDIAGKLLNGLSSDARAFVGEPPPALSASAASRAAFRDLFVTHRAELLDEFDRLRPSDDRYSPLSFFFNFSHNILKGTVVDALLRGRRWPLSFNDLLSGESAGQETDAAKRALATTLMDYARRNPDTIRGRLMPVIVYDPHTGRECFKTTMRKLRE